MFSASYHMLFKFNVQPQRNNVNSTSNKTVLSKHYIHSLQVIPRQLGSTVEAQEFWTSYETCQTPSTVHSWANMLINILYN